MEGFCAGGGVAAGVCGAVAGRGVGAAAGGALCGMAGVGGAAGFGATGVVAAGGWVGVVTGASVGVGCGDPTEVDGDDCMLIDALLLGFYMRPVHGTATASLGHGLCQPRLTGSQGAVLLNLSLAPPGAAQAWMAAGPAV